MPATTTPVRVASGAVTRPPLRVLLVDPDPARRDQLQGWLQGHYEVHVAGDIEQALATALEIVPSVLVADVSTGSVGSLIERMHEELSIFEIGVMLVMDADTHVPRSWEDYTHLRRPFGSDRLHDCLAKATAPHYASAAMLRHERQRRQEAETLLDLALDLTKRHDLRDLLQRATDAATQLTGAAFGAFFYNTTDAAGHAYLLYTLSGAPLDAFERLGTPRITPLFGRTFAGQGIVRSDDIQAEPLYGLMPPHRGMPQGHLPVRSYLAVPVVSQTGVLGGLFFGHPEPAVFSRRCERVAAAIAAQAAIAIENSRLLSALREERRQSIAPPRSTPA